MLLFKSILLAVVLYLLYLQVIKLDPLKISALKLKHLLPLYLAVFLVILNWLIEFLKWNATLRYLKIKVSTSLKTKSFLAGILSGFLTPNLLGNFVGRIFYFDSAHRPAIIGVTLFSNASQFLASISFGLLSLIIIGFPSHLSGFEHLWIALLAASLSGIAFFYFRLRKLPPFMKHWEWSKSLQSGMEASPLLRFKFLFLSALRHFVFSAQYVLLLVAFGIPFELELFFLVWQVYFWSTLVPSLWLGKLLIRESIALWIFASYTQDLEVVLWCSVLLWMINQGFTALVGLPFFKLNASPVE